MKQFTDFKIFKKAIRKYWKRYAKKEVYFSKVANKRITCWWTDREWCYYFVNSKDLNNGYLNRKDVKSFFMFDIPLEDYDNYKELWEKCINQHVTFLKYGSEEIENGKFIGFAIYNNTVKYLIEKENEILSLPFFYYIKDPS